MMIPSSQGTIGPENTAIAVNATPADLNDDLAQARKTRLGSRPVLERDFIESQSIARFGRQSESRRDRRADRLIDHAEPANLPNDGQTLQIFGRSPSGRRFRVRFIPKDLDKGPIARQA